MKAQARLEISLSLVKSAVRGDHIRKLLARRPSLFNTWMETEVFPNGVMRSVDADALNAKVRALNAQGTPQQTLSAVTSPNFKLPWTTSGGISVREWGADGPGGGRPNFLNTVLEYRPSVFRSRPAGWRSAPLGSTARDSRPWSMSFKPNDESAGFWETHPQTAKTWWRTWPYNNHTQGAEDALRNLLSIVKAYRKTPGEWT